MINDRITKWTTIITNIAVVLGLIFVGLEFRNSTRATESERIDSLTQGSIDINKVYLEDAQFSDIILRSYTDPESLTPTDRDRLQHLIVINYLHFRRIHRAHQSGLLPDDVYEVEKSGIGFAFSSAIGQEVIHSFGSNDTLKENVWTIIRESSEQARAYCADQQNVCLDRYKGLQIGVD